MDVDKIVSKLTVGQETALLERRQLDAFNHFQIEGRGSVLGALKRKRLIAGDHNLYHLTDLGVEVIKLIEAKG